MQTKNGHFFGLAVACSLIALLASCATIKINMYKPPVQRTYDQIAALELYPLMDGVLKEEGYEIDERDYSRGYIRTTWREYDGEKHGFVRWREQRRYTAVFDVDRMNGRHMLTLYVEVRERAPISTDWRSKGIDRSSDSEYQRILKKLDEVVKRKGGVTV